MSPAEEVLAATTSVLLIDWPTRDVPDTLARAGWSVVVKGGPEPDDYSEYEAAGEEVAVRRVGRPPEHADLVYSHRPLSELRSIVDLALRVGAGAIWHQSGLSENGARDPAGCWVPASESRQARTMVEADGLRYVEAPYLADAVRAAAG